MSELYEIFTRIKDYLYKKDFEKLDLPELVELIIKENKTPKDHESLISIYEYVDKMEKSLEDLGTTVLNMSQMKTASSITEIEVQVRDIIMTIDQFIDGLAAILRVVEFKESKFKLKQSLAYLKSIRSLVISKTNDYKLKIIKNQLDTDSFIYFLADTIDTFLREAYVIRILKIKEVIKKNINYD